MQNFSATCLSLMTLILILPQILWAQLSPASEERLTYPESVKKYLEDIFDPETQKFKYRSEYPGGFENWQQQARSALEQLLGLNFIRQDAEDRPLRVILSERTDRGSHFLQKGSISTEPSITIPFWMLVPKGTGPFPLAILPHGHDKRGQDTYAAVYHDDAHRQKSVDGDRDVALQAVENGIIAIAPAVRGLSEEAPGVPDIRGRHGDKDCRSQFMHCLLSGRTAIAERAWDMMRIIDWAITLPQVDSTKILMMGNSGGGMVTLYTAACDKRITIAVPSCSFSVIASQDGYIYHCDCNAIPGIFQWGNLYDVAGLIAPRYLLTVNGLKDKLHSTDDINQAANRVKEIYQHAGVPSHYEHRWGSNGHRFYKELMWPFILKALENEK